MFSSSGKLIEYDMIMLRLARGALIKGSLLVFIRLCIFRSNLDQTREVCIQCSSTFTAEHNKWNSCQHHVDEIGRKGVYIEGPSSSTPAAAVVPSSGEEAPTGKWSCCGATSKSAPGCVLSPHVSREVMFEVRAEASPAVSIENIDVLVLNALSISIFPIKEKFGAHNDHYDIQLRINRSLLTDLHRYFSIDEHFTDETLEIMTPDSMLSTGPLDPLQSHSTINGATVKSKSIVSKFKKMFKRPKNKKGAYNDDDLSRSNMKEQGNANSHGYDRNSTVLSTTTAGSFEANQNLGANR
jgi:hypothetical protein